MMCAVTRAEAEPEGVWVEAPSEEFEPDLSLEDITNGRLARIIEETRLSRMLVLKAKKRRASDEYGCLESHLKAQMNHDGVVRFRVPGVGTATLMEARPLHQCDSCAASIGDGKRDPYLKVEAVA